MLTIRLYRTGKKGQPFFKIVVTDKRNATHRGRFVEEVGFVNPIKKDKAFKAERIKYWLKMGAKPSVTVFNMLLAQKIVEGIKIANHAKPKKKEETKSASVAKTTPEVKVESAKEAPEKPATEETPEVKEPVVEIEPEKPTTEEKPVTEVTPEESVPKEEVPEVKTEPKEEAPVAEVAPEEPKEETPATS